MGGEEWERERGREVVQGGEVLMIHTRFCHLVCHFPEWSGVTLVADVSDCVSWLKLSRIERVRC